jgi:hypothetical protein
MPLNIPRRESAGIASIIKISDTLVDHLIKALSAAPSIVDTDKMAQHISAYISSIPLEQLTSIIDTLYSIYHLREFSGVSSSRFLDDLIEGISSSSYAELSAKDIDSILLRQKFEKLLGIDTLRIISKASRLRSEGERIYCNSRILSDIRPVFGEDPSTKPVGAVITHTLKITHHVGKDLEDFHVVLDSYELEELRDIITRACTKDETLRGLMKEANLTDLGV